MNINAVEAEVGTKLETISGLRVLPFAANSIAPPAVIFAVPEQYTYDLTYGRGSDSFTLPVTVLVGKVSDRASRLELGEYLAGSGARSVKAVLDNSQTNAYASCDTATVRNVELGTITVSSVEYLGATFNVDITGPGS